MSINIEYQDQHGNWHHYQSKQNQADAYRVALRRAESTKKRHRLVDDDGRLEIFWTNKTPPAAYHQYLGSQTYWIRTIMTLPSRSRVPSIPLISPWHLWIDPLQEAIHRSHRQTLHTVEPPSIPLSTPEHPTLLLNVLPLRSWELTERTVEH